MNIFQHWWRDCVMSRYFGLHDSGILLSQSKTHAYKFHLNVSDNTVIIYNYSDNIVIIHN